MIVDTICPEICLQLSGNAPLFFDNWSTLFLQLSTSIQHLPTVAQYCPIFATIVHNCPLFFWQVDKHWTISDICILATCLQLLTLFWWLSTSIQHLPTVAHMFLTIIYNCPTFATLAYSSLTILYYCSIFATR